ncbi:S24 family peptidase [Capnocytophaga sputigena]|uniref:S24 family peptidase n=1 Tax=Capnocytophaga sputigena TaxID=1019 RepID=UPI000F714BE2|nr:S24 family peptidase [Capnocytophaga sputigena]VEI53958.1 Peptidase S24-like [Capnocytophaga sputigena]
MKTLTPPQIIEALAEYLKISVAELSQKAGYERAQSFYDVLNGKTKNISPKMAKNIVSAFPEINKDWLLTGNGEMLVQNTPEEEPEEEDELVTFLRVERKNYDIPLIDISEKTGIPQKLLKDFQWGDAELSDEFRDRLYYFIEEIREYFVDNAIGEAKGKPTGYYYPEVSASAGFDIATFNNEAMRIPIYLPEFGKDIIFINVYGDSMYPKYKSGDMIGVKPTDFQYVVFGHPYVVVFDNGDVNIKYVCKGSDNEHVNLVSENPQYEPREYPLSIIRSFYTVKGCVNRERM